jgi:hypothetical protein
MEILYTKLVVPRSILLFNNLAAENGGKLNSI